MASAIEPKKQPIPNLAIFHADVQQNQMAAAPRGSRPVDTLPRVDATSGEAYHQLKRRNHEPVDALP